MMSPNLKLVEMNEEEKKNGMNKTTTTYWVIRTKKDVEELLEEYKKVIKENKVLFDTFLDTRVEAYHLIPEYKVERFFLKASMKRDWESKGKGWY